jgi:hypothetical protein
VTLRRYIERIAVASLPTLGWLGCGTPTPSSSGDLQAVVIDDQNDLGCPMTNEPCFWLAYVDGGTPADKITYWSNDAGVDNCAPCGFAHRANVYCGQCEVVQHGCGNAYFCSTFNCADACGATGRRPPGLWLPAPATAASDGIGFELARMAHLEAASVPAFAQLAAELAAHGAPERLIAGARRALADEERHARVVGDLAGAFGARALAVDVEPRALRPLAAIAIDNAVEGCVRETMGAAMAGAQARRLRDRTLAEPLAAIAVDERRHANLAWAIDAWARPRLAAAERHAVARARLSAVAEMVSRAC